MVVMGLTELMGLGLTYYLYPAARVGAMDAVAGAVLGFSLDRDNFCC